MYHGSCGDGHIELPNAEEKADGAIAFVAYAKAQEPKNINDTERGSVRESLDQRQLTNLLKSTSDHKKEEEMKKKSKDGVYHVKLKHCGCDPAWCRWAQWECNGRKGPRPKHRQRAGWGPHTAGDQTHKGYLYGDELMNLMFATALKGRSNYWTKEGMDQLCHALLSQRNESVMRKDGKRNPKDRDHTRTNSFDHRNAATGVELNHGRGGHVKVLEEELGMVAGCFMVDQLMRLDKEIKKMVDHRQTKEERGARKLRQLAKRTAWSGSSVGKTLTSYFGQGGGYAFANAGDFM